MANVAAGMSASERRRNRIPRDRIAFAAEDAIAAIHEGSSKDGLEVARFVIRRDRVARGAPQAPHAWADSVRAACAGAKPGSIPLVPHGRRHLWLVRAGENAWAWLTLGPDERRRPVQGAAEIAAMGEVLAGGRRVEVFVLRRRPPSCAQIAELEAAAKEWMEAIVAANR
jgi:hypothetical protein